MLKYLIDAEAYEELDASIKPLYEESESGVGYVLLVDGAVPKVRLDEFRSNNIAANKKAEELEKALSAYRQVGDDPNKVLDELRALRDLRKKVDDKELVNADGLEKAVLTRTEQMKSDFTGRISALESSLNEAQDRAGKAARQLEQHMIDTQISAACLEAGALPKAIPDLLTRAQRAGWRINDRGKLVLVQDGEVAYAADGHSPMSPKEWLVSKVRDDAPYFWPAATGGGASGHGSGGGTSGSGGNPWTKDAWNLTEQGRLYRDNPERARQLAGQAGVKIQF